MENETTGAGVEAEGPHRRRVGSGYIVELALDGFYVGRGGRKNPEDFWV